MVKQTSSIIKVECPECKSGDCNDIQRQYRTFYPDTGECIDCYATSLTEVYSAALKRPGTRGVIKVMAVGGWADVLGFEIPNK